MVISELVRETASRLKDNALFEAELMVMSALKINRTQLVLRGNTGVESGQISAVSDMVKRRLGGEPLQYILGETEFMSLDFYVESGVLIPRSDTETLVEEVLDKISGGAKVLDICAGSGCIGISIAHYKPDVTVDLLDISEKALNVARKNIIRNNVGDRVKVIKTDILKEYPNKKYDAAVSNPPYIETEVIETLQTEVKNHEPRLALDGGADGLEFYRRITEIAPEFLDKGGILAFEIGYNQSERVFSLMERSFENIKVIRDLNNNDRVVTGILKG
ncbi:MAG: peptide chain release factor N(5)-glutamine methyltransferase [Oscillospiraceae bacterium]|nr:peptide chain release factor N(5)-glutamine methyltransferase [Oscillospiraceae bacterium]